MMISRHPRSFSQFHVSSIKLSSNSIASSPIRGRQANIRCSVRGPHSPLPPGRPRVGSSHEQPLFELLDAHGPGTVALGRDLPLRYPGRDVVIIMQAGGRIPILLPRAVHSVKPSAGGSRQSIGCMAICCRRARSDGAAVEAEALEVTHQHRPGVNHPDRRHCRLRLARPPPPRRRLGVLKDLVDERRGGA